MRTSITLLGVIISVTQRLIFFKPSIARNLIVLLDVTTVFASHVQLVSAVMDENVLTLMNVNCHVVYQIQFASTCPDHSSVVDVSKALLGDCS